MSDSSRPRPHGLLVVAVVAKALESHTDLGARFGAATKYDHKGAAAHLHNWRGLATTRNTSRCFHPATAKEPDGGLRVPW